MSSFTPHDVAKLVQVSPTAVLRWIAEGKLRASRVPGEPRQVAIDELIAFLKAHHLPVPRALEPERVRLLVIDDQAPYLKALGAALRHADARLDVELAESAPDGLLNAVMRRPEVVLVDSYMPGMDGLEVCRRLKASAATARIAVVAMSGRPSAELEGAFLGAGAAAFLAKPLEAAGVLATLDGLGLLKSRESRGG